MAAVTISSDFWVQENKVSHCFHCFPSFCHEVMILDAMILVFWMLSFKPSFSLSSINFVEKLFSSSSLSSIMVVSSVYLRLLIFFLALLIPACTSSCLAFCLMYSAYKLNKQGDNIQPWHSPFLIWNQSGCSMSSSNCWFLTCIQISQEAYKVVWYSQLFKNFPQIVVIHTVRGFGFSRWLSRRMWAHIFLWGLQNYNLLLNKHRQESIGSPPTKIPHIQGQRRSPSKMGGGAKSHLDSNLLHTRDSQRAQISLVCTRDPTETQRPHRDWARTVFECLLWRYGSAVACPMNLLMDFTSSTLDTMFSLWLRKEWDLPFLHRPGPRIHGIHQIRDSVDKEASHLASFLTRLNKKVK